MNEQNAKAAAARQTTGGWWAFCNHKVADGRACGIRCWIPAATHQVVPIPRRESPDSHRPHVHREVDFDQWEDEQ